MTHWLHCWKQCDQTQADLVVIHNQEIDNARYEQLCLEHGVRYVSRENRGFDIGAFQDVCRERLVGFPRDWVNLLWITDDCFPMQKDFVVKYLDCLVMGRMPCYEISDQVKRHVRTTGFLVTKAVAMKLVFHRDPVVTKDDCYDFEHRRFNMYEQMVGMGITPQMVASGIDSPLWDSGHNHNQPFISKHAQVFPL